MDCFPYFLPLAIFPKRIKWQQKCINTTMSKWGDVLFCHLGELILILHTFIHTFTFIYMGNISCQTVWKGCLSVI